MNIFVVRHGQTDWNVQDLLQGSTDIKLNETGISQANKLAKKLESTNFDAIYCSPLSRTVDTANAINYDRNITIYKDKRLIEREFGNFEGLPGATVDLKKYWNYYDNLSDNNVEPLHSFFARVKNFLIDIISKYENTDKNILIVTHNGVNLAISSLINGLQDNIFSQNIAPCDFKVFQNPVIKDINPFFSIIIPAYNAEQYIDATLSSVFNQTYTDYEVIVVDDCSTDTTYQILKKCNNIKLFKTPQNLRQGGARNVGLDKCCGKYIVFLDSDDTLYDDKVLEKLHTCIINNNTPDIVYTGMKICGIRDIELIPNEDNSKKEYRLAECKWANVVSICWKNELLQKNNIRFPEQIRYEDVYFYFLGIEKSKTYAYGNFISYTYFNRASSTTTSYTFNQAIDTIKIIEKLSTLNSIIDKKDLPFLKRRIDQQAERASVRLERAINEYFNK